MDHRTHFIYFESRKIFYIAFLSLILFFSSTPIFCVSADNSMNGSKTDFDAFFKDKTMRLDYFHSGTASEEHFATDRIVSDGQWAGSKTMLTNDLNLGQYEFDILDKASGKLIFSDGFASVYGEWQTTGDAQKQWGTFHESIRFPWPKNEINVVLKKRDNLNQFKEIWNTTINPNARYINTADIVSPNTVYTYLNSGPVNEKIDIVILGDGYTIGEMGKFEKDVDRLMDAFFSVEPYKSRKSDFNVRAVETISGVSGVTRPHFDVYKRTPLSVHYSSFDSERYALTYDNRTVREVASKVPYDFMFIFINERTYGGGGIYKTYATVAVDNVFSDYIVAHEFGHHFAALSDEYYTSQIAYDVSSPVTVEPWELNVTALLDPKNLKWKDLVTPGTPIPTPWDKEKFDTYSNAIQQKRQQLRDAKAPEEEMEKLLLGERKEESQILSNMKYTGKVGAFEGAAYYYKGMYRSSADCIMFTRNMIFCPVCNRALNLVMDRYTH